MTNHSSLQKAAKHIFAMANRHDLNPYERQTFLNRCFDLNGLLPHNWQPAGKV